jgi:hypothetical protein
MDESYRTDQVSVAGIWGRDIPDANAENGEYEITRCIEMGPCRRRGNKRAIPRPE